ncbi:hypothetical protein ARMGADRAFT_161371 [Armillaria gallica]|uniref:Uncharacterized protein n=1 Tax=Armillaria gallica TaxID=47427 RepID=A0A2H3DYC3_ARMGA|nr:hypothetical protein ARMGADRAFT_161371 [Armillaria gallica]
MHLSFGSIQYLFPTKITSRRTTPHHIASLHELRHSYYKAAVALRSVAHLKNTVLQVSSSLADHGPHGMAVLLEIKPLSGSFFLSPRPTLFCLRGLALLASTQLSVVNASPPMDFQEKDLRQAHSLLPKPCLTLIRYNWSTIYVGPSLLTYSWICRQGKRNTVGLRTRYTGPITMHP